VDDIEFTRVHLSALIAPACWRARRATEKASQNMGRLSVQAIAIAGEGETLACYLTNSAGRMRVTRRFETPPRPCGGSGVEDMGLLSIDSSDQRERTNEDRAAARFVCGTATSGVEDLGVLSIDSSDQRERANEDRAAARFVCGTATSGAGVMRVDVERSG
jgi:hypothetical protein